MPGQGLQSINEPQTLSLNEVPKPDAPDVPLAILALEPATCAVGGEDFILYVRGTGFTDESVIHFAGQDEPTTLEADGSLSTVVKPSLWADPTTVQCTVIDGEVTSEPKDFTFTAAAGP